MEGRVVDGKAVILEHVKKGSLSCIVEAQEKDLCALVVETCTMPAPISLDEHLLAGRCNGKKKERRTQERENTPEPIEEIHYAARKKQKVECGIRR